MKKNTDIILASKSPYRAQLLAAAGVQFRVQPASIDERAVEAPLLAADMDEGDIALVLAQTKALSLSEKNVEAVVIGADQTLTFEGKLLHKPEDMEAARRRLLLLSGKSHILNSAVALAKNGKILWHHGDKATITFRKLKPEFIGRHLANVGQKALTSVGAYQIEGEGVQLFEAIEGDFFSIMGLPLLPLLKQLRQMELIDG
ncbi:MAG: Maf-like protein [Rhizobiaceae bacterium]|nr:Maf-like protein [Rhizobiaceae bacterium]